MDGATYAEAPAARAAAAMREKDFIAIEFF